MNKYAVKFGNGEGALIEADTFDAYQQQGVVFSVREPNPEYQHADLGKYTYTSVAFFRDVEYVILAKDVHLKDPEDSA